MSAQILTSSGITALVNTPGNSTTTPVNTPGVNMAASQTSLLQSPVVLLDLPPEVFNIVAEKLIGKPVVRIRVFNRRGNNGGPKLVQMSPTKVVQPAAHRRRERHGHFDQGFSLLRANKHLHTQYTAMAYGRVRLEFETPQAFKLFFVDHQAKLGYVRHVTLHFMPRAYNYRKIFKMLKEFTGLVTFTLAHVFAARADLRWICDELSGHLKPMFLRIAAAKKNELGGRYNRLEVVKAFGIIAYPLIGVGTVPQAAIQAMRGPMDRSIEAMLEAAGY